MSSSKESVTKLFDFMLLLGKLKHTERTGWVKRGVDKPESIADHMYRMAMMSFLIEPDSAVNRERCMKISLVHDMAESIVGDITPVCGVDKESKYQMEKDAMMHIKTLVSEELGEELYALWQEYENQETAEAKFVKDLDKFDLILQAYEYETTQTHLQLQEFFDSTKGAFQSEKVKQWTEHLYGLRKMRSEQASAPNNGTSEGGQNVL